MELYQSVNVLEVLRIMLLYAEISICVKACIAYAVRKKILRRRKAHGYASLPISLLSHREKA